MSLSGTLFTLTAIIKDEQIETEESSTCIFQKKIIQNTVDILMWIFIMYFKIDLLNIYQITKIDKICNFIEEKSSFAFNILQNG